MSARACTVKKRRNVSVRASSESLLRAAINLGKLEPLSEGSIAYLSQLFDREISESTLSPRQFHALQFLRTCNLPGRRMPSTREIAARLGLRSQASAIRLLRHLEAKGFIKREKYESRAIEMLS